MWTQAGTEKEDTHNTKQFSKYAGVETKESGDQRKGSLSVSGVLTESIWHD